MILYDTKYLQLKDAKSKTRRHWVYAHRPNTTGVVVILPIIENDKVLFLIEQRPPLIAEDICKYNIALPAGLVGDVRINETIEDAAKTELLEETGLKADKIKLMTKKIATSPGCVSETFYIIKAYVNEYKLHSKPISDGGVICDRVLIKINEIKNWLKEKENEGFVLTSQALAALFFLYNERGEI